MNDIVERLRSLADAKHDDLSIGHEAADEIERLRAERDLWQSRCIAALWLVPHETTCGELQEAARRAKALLGNERSPK